MNLSTTSTYKVSGTMMRVVVVIVVVVHTFALHIRSPESQVVPQELHDKCRIFVALLIQCVQLGDSLIKCCLSESACSAKKVSL